MTQGDLAVRLGITSSYYEPIALTQAPATFDDSRPFRGRAAAAPAQAPRRSSRMKALR